MANQQYTHKRMTYDDGNMKFNFEVKPSLEDYIKLVKVIKDSLHGLYICYIVYDKYSNALEMGDMELLSKISNEDPILNIDGS